MAQDGDLDILFVERWSEPEQVKEPADKQEGDRTHHLGDLGRCAAALLRG
jgi:hypothetical protein